MVRLACPKCPIPVRRHVDHKGVVGVLRVQQVERVLGGLRVQLISIVNDSKKPLFYKSFTLFVTL